MPLKACFHKAFILSFYRATARDRMPERHEVAQLQRASMRGFEPPTPRLGVALISYLHVMSDAQKSLIFQHFHGPASRIFLMNDGCFLLILSRPISKRLAEYVKRGKRSGFRIFLIKTAVSFFV